MKLLDPASLSRGGARQKQAYEVIQRVRVFELLKDHSPVIAGALPLDIDTPESDIDVVCSASNLETFANEVRSLFGKYEGFELHHKLKKSVPSVVARFREGSFTLEIFAQTESVFRQHAVVHMLVEARLLAFAPAEAKDFIRRRKQEGVKTEPAFAECFDISGDPYEELLKIAQMTDHEILGITHRFRFKPSQH